MKKKLFTLFLCIVAALTACFALASCGDPGETEHTTHVYDQKVTTNTKYRKTLATCTEPAVYYYSCECGEKGTQTFNHGEPKGHADQLTVGGTYKTSYLPGESFDSTGMVINRECMDCDDKGTVTDYTISPKGALAAGANKVTIATASGEVDVNITVENIAVTNVDLSVESGAVYYVVSGNYAAGYDISAENVYFDLATNRTAFVYIDKEDIILTKNDTDKTFTLKANITDWSGNGRPLYPHMHVDGKKYDLVEATNKWNNISVTANDSKYTIVQTDTVFNMPTVQRIYTGTKAGTVDYEAIANNGHTKMVFGDNIYYQATGVEFKTSQDGQKALIIVSGESAGFNFAQLEAELNFQVRKGSTGYIEATDGGLLTLDAVTGNWSLECNVTPLPSSKDGYVYFTRFGETKAANNANLYDFDTLTLDQVIGEGTSVTIGSKIYTFLYDPTSNAADMAYGCVGIKVQTVQS